MARQSATSEEVERVGGRRHHRGLHPRRHVRVLHQSLPLQHCLHPANLYCCSCAAPEDRSLLVRATSLLLPDS
uniref:Uncharacterized protein n=1 Tax=Arundo donax TaxID=35708 RepID=A0A0A9AJ38_ARUDO